MSATIKATNDKIMELVDKVQFAPPPLNGWKVRFGFIAYSHFGLKSQFVIQDFTSSRSLFSKSLNQLTCSPCSLSKYTFAKAVMGGIEKATLFSWESTSRTIVHIGDTSVHGHEFQYPGAKDQCQKGSDPLKLGLKKVFTNLKTDCKVGFKTRLGQGILVCVVCDKQLA